MVAQMIDRPTLVLNRNWQPVNVSTVARAQAMLWKDTARVVDPRRTTGTTGCGCAPAMAICSFRPCGCV